MLFWEIDLGLGCLFEVTPPLVTAGIVVVEAIDVDVMMFS